MATREQDRLDDEARDLIHAFAHLLVSEGQLLRRLREIALEWMRLENEASC
jgi:hypothetical protein